MPTHVVGGAFFSTIGVAAQSRQANAVNQHQTVYTAGCPASHVT
ncbi:MAG: hypothetical protein RLZZ97_2436 [Gemmatimonadota bacterium]